MNRKTARENAFILLFEQACKTDETAEEIFEKAVSCRELECDEYVKRVFFGVRENLTVIDDAIEKNLQGWNKKRISFASKAILRLASYELMFMDDIPPKVSINEGIELSKKYDDEKTYTFVNGVLNGVAEYLGRK
ncbi:MAG: transcription antitermination factor NusB [Clostridia bacterium]|nr:transcription antitermination factor NusB [Clostridia bacterium]